MRATQDRTRHILTAQSGGRRILLATGRRALTTRKETTSDIWRWPRLKPKAAIRLKRRTTINTPNTISGQRPRLVKLHRRCRDDRYHNSLGKLGCGAHTVSMDDSRSLEIRVEKRGDKYVWELHREGVAQPVKFSAPVYLSEEAARTSGDDVRKDHLARLAARSTKRTSVKKALP
jgi:hypothetical protein